MQISASIVFMRKKDRPNFDVKCNCSTNCRQIARMNYMYNPALEQENARWISGFKYGSNSNFYRDRL